MRTTHLLAGVAGITALLLAGCSSTGSSGQQAPAPVENRGQPEVSSPQVQQVTPEAPSGSPLAELHDPKSILSKRSVYFDFDSFVVKDEFRPLIEAHARFLMAHPDIKMLIQGNTDERGSREYNVALGQKRADAIKKALVLLGAKDAQIESVSLGEEKPKNPGHDEAAYTENRRGDMLYTGEF